MAALVYPRVNNQAVGATRVYTRAAWEDAWTAQPQLACRRLTLAAAPGISSAEVRYRFGQTLAAGASSWQARTVAATNPRTFVKIEVDDAAGTLAYNWIGVWRRAQMSEPTQLFVADGLEKLLDSPILESPFVSRAGNSRWAGRGLPFISSDDELRNNRTSAKIAVHGVQAYAWGNRVAAGVDLPWNTREAFRTILAMGTPLDADGDVLFNWTLTGDTALPDFDRVNLPTHGKTYWEVLTSLASRFRQISFVVTYPGNVPTVTPVTMTAAAIPLTNGAGANVGNIPAAAVQHTVNLAADQSASASLSQEASGMVERVRVIGDPRRSVFTVDKVSGRIADGWTAAQETAYRAGASGTAGYAALDKSEQERRDRDARNAEALRAVYSLFKLPDAWDQTDAQNNAVAKTDDNPPVAYSIYEGGLQLLDHLPLLTGYDYDGIIIANNANNAGHRGNVVGNPPHTPRPLLAVLPVEYSGGNPVRWVQAEHVGGPGDIEQPDGTPLRGFSCEVRAVRGAPALELRVHGKPQHAIAKLGMAGQSGEVPNALDSSKAKFTVAIEDTRYCEVTYPQPAVPFGEWIDTLEIRVPGAKLDYVAPDTVVGVDAAGDLVTSSSGGILQDDRDQLRLIAQRAYAWHKTPRASLSYNTNTILSGLQIGSFITGYTGPGGTFPVNSAVTEITMQFPVAQSHKPPPPNVSVTTAFGEFDPTFTV